MFEANRKIKINEKMFSLWFVLICFFIYFFWAMSQPFGGGPDEKMRFLIPKYIFNHLSLPHALDPEVIYPKYGFSYASHPMLSYIISALFMRIASIFSSSGFTLLIAARMTGVLSGVVYVIFVIKISNLLFKELMTRWLFIVLCSLWPQMAFMFTYVNCDAMALMGVSIILYSWIRGFKEHFNVKTCLIMALGVSICTLTYENSYIYIPFSFAVYLLYFIFYEKDTKKWKKFFINGIIVLCAFFLLTGWHFIRNCIVYNQLFPTGIRSSEFADNILPELTSSARKANALEILSTWQGKFSWIKCTLKSFIATFGQMSIELPELFYYFYYALIGVSGVSFLLSWIFNKKMRIKTNVMMSITAIVLILSAIGLSYYYSQSDYQPQGRYVLTALIPVCYIITMGISNLFKNSAKINSAICKCVIGLISVTVLLCPMIVQI